MRNLMNFFGGLQTSALGLLLAVVLIFSVVGMVGSADAQTSRYTIDDVMDKLIEVDKRLTVVETEVRGNRELIETVNTNLTKQIETVNMNLGARISDTNTTMFWLFGFLGSLFLGILAFTFATYRNTASLVKPTERSVAEETKVEAFGKELKAVAERERVLEEKLQASDRSVPKILEALEQKVSALAERQIELEGKLKLAEV